MTKLSDWLIQQRYRLKLKQKGLAKEVGVSRPYVSMCERGVEKNVDKLLNYYLATYDGPTRMFWGSPEPTMGELALYELGLIFKTKEEAMNKITSLLKKWAVKRKLI